ncbi:MAG TPA: HAMP domain-containing sensor histidine kinase [Polyangiaceae bacterium]
MVGSELRAELVADGQVPVFAVRDGRVQEANASARAVFAMLRVGADVSELFDERSWEKLAEALRKSTFATSPELQVRRSSGPPVAVRFLILSCADEQLFIAQHVTGYSEGMVEKLMQANSTLANTTRELSRQARDLDVAKRRLQQQAELREMFIAALAHDLKAPLNSILLTEASLRHKASTARPVEPERHAERVERHARRMVALIDSLLLAARLDAVDGALPAGSVEPVRVDELARRVVDGLSALAADAHVTLAVNAPDAVRAPGNADWLEQVFANLLTNAIRHSPPGRGVDVTVALEGEEAVCRVADEGPGVSREDSERIFERFVQGGERRGSVGLGLYICRRIVSLHGGRIWVEANPGGGARFGFTLPQASLGE